jgi:hypothetical protein
MKSINSGIPSARLLSKVSATGRASDDIIVEKARNLGSFLAPIVERVIREPDRPGPPEWNPPIGYAKYVGAEIPSRIAGGSVTYANGFTLSGELGRQVLKAGDGTELIKLTSIHNDWKWFYTFTFIDPKTGDVYQHWHKADRLYGPLKPPDAAAVKFTLTPAQHEVFERTVHTRINELVRP